jgi:murein DD-endopeptidase MepM/ murein hydrolase activator NlpD
MEDLEQKDTEELEVSLAEGYADPEVKQSLFLRHPKRFRLFLTCLFLVSFVLIYIKFLRPADMVTLPQTPVAIVPKDLVERIIIEKGQTIGKILASYGISYQDVNAILKAAALQKVDMVKLNPGQVIEIQHETDSSGSKVLSSLTTQLNATAKLQIARDQASNSFKAAIVTIELVKEFVPFGGKIKNSLMVSAIRSGVPIPSLIEATNACSYEIDFQREVKDGDSFKILVEKFTSKENGSVTFGKAVFFALKLKGKEYKLYKFKPQNAREEFFTDQFQSAKRGLLKTPVSASRISSGFGMRKHPILGYSLMHKGVDFAAPAGTAIYAAGDGVVLQMGRNLLSGNYLKIKHNAKLTTVYCHMSNFAKALKQGMRVQQGQVVAFVGATGRATGSHLHYEILVQGRHVDPMKFKLPSITTLKGLDAENFKVHKAHVDSLLGNALFS